MSDYNVNVSIKLTDNITTPLQNLNKQLDNCKTKMQQLNKISNDLAKSLGNLNSRFTNTTNAVKNTGEAMKNTRASAQNLKSTTDQVKTSTETLNAKTKDLNTSMNNSRNIFQRVGSSIKTYVTAPFKTCYEGVKILWNAFKDTSVGSKLVSIFTKGKEAVQKFVEKVKDTGQKLNDLKGKMSELKSSFLNCFNEGILAPFYNKLTSIFNLTNAINFGKKSLELSFDQDKAKATMEMLDATFMDELKNSTYDTYGSGENGFKNMAHANGMSEAEALNNLSYLKLAGYGNGAALSSGEDFMKFAKLTNYTEGTDTQTITDLLTDSLNGLYGANFAKQKVGESDDEYAKRVETTVKPAAKTAMDVLSKGSSIWNANVTQLTEGLKRSAPASKLAGLDIYNAVAMEGTIANIRKGNEAGNALDAIWSRMLGANGDKDPVIKALSQMGVSFQYNKDGSVKDAVGTMKQISEKIGTMNETQGNGIAAVLSKELGGAYRFKDLLTITEAFRDGSYDQNVKDLKDGSGGELERRSEILKSTPEFQLDQLKFTFSDNVMANLAQGFKDGFGPAFKDTFKDIMDFLQDPDIQQAIHDFGENMGTKLAECLSWMWEHKEEIWDCAKAVAEVFIAFQTVQTVLNVISFLGKIPGIFSAIAAVANPITITIGVLVGLFVGLWQNSDTFRESCKKAWDTLKEKFTNAWNAIKPGLEKLVTAIQNLLEALGPIAGKFVEIASSILGDFAEALGFFGGIVFETAAKAIETLATLVRDLWDLFTKPWSEQGQKIADACTEMATSGQYVNNSASGSGTVPTSGNSGKAPGQTAKGTDDWEGGFTYVNEGYKGELIDLPSGTRVIPNDLSKRIIDRNAQNKQAPVNNTTINLGGVVIREEADIDKIGRELTTALERYRVKMA